MQVALQGFDQSADSGRAGMDIRGAAAGALCREHMNDVQDFADSLGG